MVRIEELPWGQRGSPGIYVIHNKVNDHIYVGSAVNLSHRWAIHKHQFSQNKNSPYLQRSWNKHGADAFSFYPILFCAKEHLIYWEQWTMDLLQPDYNIAKIAGSRLGVPNSIETRKKISSALTGRKLSEETKHKMRLRMQGEGNPNHNGLSDTHKEKLRLAHLGRYERDLSNIIFVSPDGDEYHIEGIPILAETFDLDPSSLYKLVSGKLLQVKGWSIKGRLPITVICKHCKKEFRLVRRCVDKYIKDGYCGICRRNCNRGKK